MKFWRVTLPWLRLSFGQLNWAFSLKIEVVIFKLNWLNDIYQISLIYYIYFGVLVADECSMDQENHVNFLHVLNQKPLSTDTGSPLSKASQPNIDAVYRQAIEFINLADEIKKSPEGLRVLHDQLRKACSELSSSIDLLRHQANELQGLVKSNTTEGWLLLLWWITRMNYDLMLCFVFNLNDVIIWLHICCIMFHSDAYE